MLAASKVVKHHLQISAKAIKDAPLKGLCILFERLE